VAAPDRARSLLRAWTSKEAILKATGEGLPGDMTSLEVSAADVVLGQAEFARAGFQEDRTG
jgi:phosphopantetheinyl transferase